MLLLAASYLFYAWWKPMYLILLAGSTIIDYIVGLLLERTRNHVRRTAIFLVSITVNLGILMYFKYGGLNFQVQHWVSEERRGILQPVSSSGAPSVVCR